ncbi:hypothetical protein B0H17DRAFT_1189965, partial [Mycena rosella]
MQCEMISEQDLVCQFRQVVRLLRQLLVEDRLPDSWKRVFSAEFLNLIPLVYELVEVDIVVRDPGISDDEGISPREISDVNEGELEGEESGADSYAGGSGQGIPVASTVPVSFRALPLLPTDLPHTTVTVSHSFVRPNDRGKEVLSFVVSVDPGNNKEGWKVEKMYSDVLALDQRVRNSVGKGVGKKIVSLPEGKLWKDQAPAKVDQRKAILETYLQTLINLPVKNNDEVIAFFTFDIIREYEQPVVQVGHKESYLTKRGKNFGGWKTRFFVLQGPVLEYYDY